jgi:hypothetical protein
MVQGIRSHFSPRRRSAATVFTILPASNLAKDNVPRATAVLRRSGSSRSDDAGHIKAGSAAAMHWTQDMSRSGAHGIVIAVRYRSCSSGLLSCLRGAIAMPAATAPSRGHDRSSAGPVSAFCPSINGRARLPASCMVGDRRMCRAAVTPTAVSIARNGAFSFKAFLASNSFDFPRHPAFARPSSSSAIGHETSGLTPIG